MSIIGSIIVLLAALAGLVYVWRSRRNSSLILRDNSELFARARLLYDHSSQAIVTVDRGGLICGINPAAEDLFGYPADELARQSILRVVPDAPSLLAVLRNGLADADVRRKDSSRRRVRCSAAIFESSRGEETYLFFDGPSAGPPAVATAALSLSATRKLVGRIASQFENLLTTINGYSGLALENSPSNSPAREDLTEIAAASDETCKLIQHLLVFSGNQPIPVEPVDLNQLMRDMQGELLGTMRGSIEVDLRPTSQEALVNADCLRQVIRMLCESARIRMRETDRLRIRVETCKFPARRTVYTGDLEAGTYRVLAFSDSAAPLSRETQAHLFDPLYQSSASIGVEISPVYGIVTSFGGGIEVKSEPGSGTTFEVFLPHVG